MSIQEVSAEQIAELFHHYYQAIGPDFGGGKNVDPEAWEHIPQQERSRFIAAARLTLLEIKSLPVETATRKSYFAKPGEAEWGC